MSAGSGRFLRMSYLAAGLGGLGFFALSILLLAIWPGQVLEEQTRTMSPAHPLDLTVSEKRGREIYGREGCAYCHTEQIRYLDADVKRFGAPTLAWETRFDYPQLWGTRRIGPDLSREGAIRPADWQLSHLYEPRSIVPDSVMPSYPWLFNGAPDRPNQGGRDLLAYLQSLGRGRELAGAEGESKVRLATNNSEDMKRLEFGNAVLNASPAIARRTGDAPELPAVQDHALGQTIYQQNCVGCHGRKGEGDGPGAMGLTPRPANLAEHEYAMNRLSFVFHNGVEGTSMPAWRDLSLQDLAAVAEVVRGFHTAQPEPAPPADLIELGSRVYADHCAQCHGEKGMGDGSAVAELAIAPPSFVTQRPSPAASLQALRSGVAGTRMAPWTSRLTEAELSAVALYVRNFYRPDGAVK